MVDSEALLKDADEFAQLAKRHETNNELNSAIFYYKEAAQAILNAIESGTSVVGLDVKVQEYIEKIKILKEMKSSSQSADIPSTAETEYKAGLARINFLLNDAVTEDENENDSEAIISYTYAIELLLELEKTTSQSSGFSSGAGSSKTITTIHPNKASYKGYSSEELRVLRATSVINGCEYLPFMSDVDSKERFSFSNLFTDPMGLLKLSEKQKLSLQRWVRPSEYINKPQMIMAISCFSVCQRVVTDCSFVSSIAVAAQYERRFKKRLITNIIYPQSANGEPIYNPCGKYMVRLCVNGVLRKTRDSNQLIRASMNQFMNQKIIIDDLLPMGKDGKLLCCYSSNTSELWISLLEKAYMKLMGGYDFPGSNSNIDLHALTSWIPERIGMRSESTIFNKDREFRRLLDRFHRGHCLITVSTSHLSDAEEERTGLVPVHAYALLDMRQVSDYRLLLLKNPWSHVRWKGNFSERDTKHWTPELQAKLNFDLTSAQSIDNGVFWIDYDSLCHFFDTICVNWDPALFPYTTCVNDYWLASSGPRKDLYSCSYNPQYQLIVNAKCESPVWILLTRHITEKDDFAENKEYIAVVVYKDVKSRKVYYPSDPSPYRDSVRINSPHCLVKLLQDPGTSNYVLLISQYEKSNTIYYTLRVYSTSPFTLNKIVDPYKVNKQITGDWKGIAAGGCMNDPEKYKQNPCYQINLANSDVNNQLLLELRGPREYGIGIHLLKISLNNPLAPNNLDRWSSEPYRKGYCYVENAGLSGGIYNIIVSTYKPDQEGPYILTIKSIFDFQITKLR